MNTTISSDKSFNFTQIYGSYIGGNGEDKAKGVFTDADGNIYLVMETNSNDLNTTAGVYQATKSGGKDIYVAKFDSTGEIIFATFIGGSSTEFEKDFKVDGEGNIYITGLTASPDFPTTDNALIRNLTGSQSAYLTVLSADGKKLKYSTYLGGSKVDRGWALVIDDEGNAFVQGITNSIDFPVTDDAYQSDKDGVDWDSNTSSDDIDFQNSFDLFVSEINTKTGELVYSTYFGGRGSDSTYGSLAVKDDIIYFAGTTTSIDFPTTANANRTVRNVGEADSFLAAINITSGELLYSSYIGGSSTDDGEALFISDDGFLYYLGDTWSSDFPTTANAYQRAYGGVGDGISGGDIFAMKFDTSDWSIVYSTYVGGDADEGGRAIAVDDEGNLYIGGMSQSSNFPVTDDAFQKVKNGQVYVQDPQQHADYYTMDAILSVLSADGSDLLYSTYIGGNYGEFIMGVELIDGGVILQFRTYSDDLWVSDNAFQKVKGTDLYNPSLAYIGTIYEDYYANRTIYDMDTYLAKYLFPNIKNTTVVNAPDVEKFFNGEERFVVNVTDKKGNPLVNKSVNITINGVSYPRITNSNGTTSIALRLSSGTYNVTSVVDNITVNSVVTIKSTINGNDITKVFRNGTQYYATFTDSKGNLLANGTMVRFNIHGVMYDRKVNENGTAKLNINLAQGTYILTAINPDNGEMVSNTITVLPKIIENSDLVKYFKNDSQYVVRLIGDDGNPVGAGETVTFNINGVMYERKTNTSGYAKLNINLGPGDYIITAMYGGCNVANNIKVKPVLNATNITMSYRDGTQFKASLVDGQGNPYAGQNITFNINGIFYNRTTDSQGIAKLNINLMAGEYIITSMYNNGAISNKITISA